MGVDAETKRRLKAAASAKGVSVSVYCRAAIDKELAQDEERAEAKRLPADAAARFEATRRKYRGSSAEPALEMLRKHHEEHAQDAGEGGEERWPDGTPMARFEATRRKYGSAKPTTKTAVDYIREGREIRDREMDGWLKPKRSLIVVDASIVPSSGLWRKRTLTRLSQCSGLGSAKG